MQVFDAERQIPPSNSFCLTHTAIRAVHDIPIRFDAFYSPSKPDRQAATHWPTLLRLGRATASPISRLERLGYRDVKGSVSDYFTSCLFIYMAFPGPAFPFQTYRSMSLFAASSLHVTRSPGTDEVPDAQNDILSLRNPVKDKLDQSNETDLFSLSAS